MAKSEAPPLVDFLLEAPRAARDLQRSLLLAPWLRFAPRGDGHPVLVLPGYLADDRSTAPLRAWLRSLGYPAYRWRLGRNLGPTEAVVGGLRRSLSDLAERHERPVSLVGWSLGGIYARELARRDAASVRQVITLGSPFGMTDPNETRARPLSRRRGDTERGTAPGRYVANVEPLPVPSTAVYTRRDGIVAWRTCLQRVDGHSENVEVAGAHVGLGHHPAVLWLSADRLAQPEGAWRPFRAPTLLRRWYPEPSAPSLKEEPWTG